MLVNLNNRDHLNAKLFLDEQGVSGIARYDRQKYPKFEKYVVDQIAQFWRPDEIDLTEDSAHFKKLNTAQEHIFTSNLKRQTTLDTVQGVAPLLLFGPVCSLPEVQNWLGVWGFSEMIHSRSYSHIIRNIYPRPSVVFDGIPDVQEIVQLQDQISKYYDKLDDMNKDPNVFGTKEHKKAILMAIMACNALEGIRFYVSFACSWAFNEMKLMKGNSNIITLICRDENLHLGSTQYLLKVLRKDDPDYETIWGESLEDFIHLYQETAEQEMAWADYLFKDGAMLGLNAEVLKLYVKYITDKRMKAIGLPELYGVKDNPLPWTNKYISIDNVQPAPQETELKSYRVKDLDTSLDHQQIEDMGDLL